jgi:aarF domain-containing kinase
MTSSTIREGRAVPSHRLRRLWHIGRASTDLAAGIGWRGFKEIMHARKTAQPARLQINPEATQRFTNQLAQMRGAAMKMGQLMSMDGTDVLTPEAAEIMASLRDRAEPMPFSQLMRVLENEYGAAWNKRFKRFDFSPIAAASIGQVHKAETSDGRLLALKIQFPGIRDSIDSDIDNMAFLGRTMGMIPKGIDPKPLFDEARRQLHREADYHAEAQSLRAYRQLIGDHPYFIVPDIHQDFCTQNILAMDFLEGIPVDRLQAPDFTRKERDTVATQLTELVLKELFEFQLAQTDPNFSNFLYQASTKRIVLLDFGATCAVDAQWVEEYRKLALAAMNNDRQALHQAAIGLGYCPEDSSITEVSAMLDLILLSGELLRQSEPYDFGTSDLFERIYVQGRDFYRTKPIHHMPDPASLFLHRKFVGIFMLARRLRARVPLAAMLSPYL